MYRIQMSTRQSAMATGLALALLACSAQASVNKSIKIDDGTQAGGQSTVNGSITIGSSAIIDGSVETVNGAIRIGDDTRVETASTVNGSIRSGANLIAIDVESVNGTIRIGEGSQVSGSVSVVNGKIGIGSGSSVAEDVSNVNGDMNIEGSQIGGDITTVTGDVTLTHGSTLSGNLLIEKPRGFGFGRRNPPRIIIGPNSRVLGSIDAEHEIELYISDSAEVGNVTGEVSMADAIRFSGDRP